MFPWCRAALYREVSAFLYHQGKFTLGPLAPNIDFLLNGPGRHLRSVAMRFRDPRVLPVYLPRESWEPIGLLAYEGRLLRAIAEKARRIEHLEIQTVKHHPPMPSGRMLRLWGVDVDFSEYSWIDPPYHLPGLSVGEIPQSPTEEQLAAMLECVAPGDDGKQTLMRGLIGDNFRHNHDPSSRFWSTMLHEVRQMTEQQLFWQHMLGVFQDMSPTLRTLSWVGVVDRKWMAALANVMDVTVRGRLDRGFGGWVTVEPSSVIRREC